MVPAVNRFEAALGRRVGTVTRLWGGSKKGVYRLGLDDGSTVIGYLWSGAENYWPARPQAPGDPFADASGPELFAANHALLEALGVRTPRVFHVDDDLAIVEDIPGGTLESLLHNDPDAARSVVERLAGILPVLHGHRAEHPGKPIAPIPGAVPERVVLDRALRDLDEAASRVERIAAVRPRTAGQLRSLAAAVAPRWPYALIHGELGPDHILVDADGEPVLIDIEGLMYFDVEWEHAFLELRFGPAYPLLRVPGLDRDRLRLYRLALHLSLVAGPLRLLDGAFPDRDAMVAIAEYNVGRVLALVSAY